jgi:hypothetical protein
MNQRAMNPAELLAGLPGADRILEGLHDFHDGRHTIPACLVRIAQPRLSRASLMPVSVRRDDGAELDLYQLLAAEGSRAHSCYNALLRELISFEHALDHRLPKLRSLPR